MEGYIFGGAVVVVFGILALGTCAETHEKEKFMADCMKDRKQYECTALWRAGEDHTTVMPVPIIYNSKR